MRTLYVLGLVVLDLLILLLGAVVIAITDLDKESGLGALRTLPTLLLVLPHFTVAHYVLSLRGDTDPEVRRKSRRTTLILAASFAAVGAVLLIGLTAAFSGPIPIALIASALGGAALAYALFVGEAVAKRYRARHPDAEHPTVDDAPIPPATRRKWIFLAVGTAVAGFVVSLALFRSVFATSDFSAAAGLALMIGGFLGCLVTLIFTWRSGRDLRRLTAANFGNRQGVPYSVVTGKFDRIRPAEEPEAVRYATRLVALQPVSVVGLALLFGGAYLSLVLLALAGGHGLTQSNVVTFIFGGVTGVILVVLLTRQYRNAKKYLALHGGAAQGVEQTR
ncbi:hypothetical protein [Naasia aerilata]|uniref:Uncharacterized protein n=1 Tax=Naasia aerilata TaxID=1162966 RepID=A0ABM8GFK7_9MICO|nr:hypothetical protein [Naasia aerilata]BDZ47126.1 hypothetical protein GCM10025866_30350 [Naasia aerilata]